MSLFLDSYIFTYGANIGIRQKWFRRLIKRHDLWNSKKYVSQYEIVEVPESSVSSDFLSTTAISDFEEVGVVFSRNFTVL
jgi:hypothetical protein